MQMSLSQFRSDLLVDRRRSCRLSRGQLAATIGRSYASVCLYEQGCVVPPEPVLARIAEALGADPNDFFTQESVGA